MATTKDGIPKRKVAALFADSPEPVYADEIGKIRLFRWTKGPRGKEKTRIPLEDFYIEGNEDELFEFDFEETDEGDLEAQFGRGDYYIDATGQETGRTLPGGHTFTLGGPLRRGGEIVDDDDGDNGEPDDDRARVAAALGQDSPAELAARAAKEAQNEQLAMLERLGVIRPPGSGPSSETMQTTANIHAQEISSLTTSHRSELSEMRMAHLNELSETRKRSSQDIDDMRKRFSDDIENMRRSMQADIDRKVDELKETRADLRKEIQRLESEKFTLQNNMSSEVAKLQRDLLTTSGEALKAELHKEAAESRIAAAEKAAILAEKDADAAALDAAEAEKKAAGGGDEEIFGVKVPKFLVPMIPKFLSFLQASGEPIPPELRGAMGAMGQQQQPYGYPPPAGYQQYAPPPPVYVPPAGPPGGYPPPPPGFPGAQPAPAPQPEPVPQPTVSVRRGPALEEQEEDEDAEEEAGVAT